MDTAFHCTWSASRSKHAAWLLALTFAVLLVHGYHPWSEDGGLYAAGIEYKLNPALFPYDTAFVTEHLRYSIFAPAVASLVSVLHLSLAVVLFALYLLTTALTLFAARAVLQQCFTTPAMQWSGVATLAAAWTLPVAGTSLLLMDPYLTARSVSTPLSLLAVAMAMRPWSRRADHASGSFLPDAWKCALLLLLATLFHPLMAFYTICFVVLLRLEVQHAPRYVAIGLALATFFAALLVQVFSRPEQPAVVLAAFSRYYWFLSQWHWYERFGLAGPLLIFTLLLFWKRAPLSSTGHSLCRAALLAGFASILFALAFGRENLPNHVIARLQPLRMFCLLYAFMLLLLGGLLAHGARLLRHKLAPRLAVPAFAFEGTVLLAIAAAMFFVARQTYPASLHLELPGRLNPNPWVESFLWVRAHSPTDAVFALDAHYVNLHGEDAEVFRSIAQRSAIPDFSKDGGEAALDAALAPAWLTSANATEKLSLQTDSQRDAHLRPLGVTWTILQSAAPTNASCPYQNRTVKVCRLLP